MAKKLDTSANNIIDKLINKFKNLIGVEIFNELFLYEQELHLERPRHLFSVEDCKTILKKYLKNLPYSQRDVILETESECLLLLYNWQKSKVIYHINITKNNNISDEYIDPRIFNQFPYPGIYIDYNFRNSEYYGVFITYYKHEQGLHLQKRFLFGFVMYDANHDIWSIEPVFFDIKNNISIIETIMTTMSEELNFNDCKIAYLDELSKLSCIVIKVFSSIIEYYGLEPIKKCSHTYKKFSKFNL